MQKDEEGDDRWPYESSPAAFLLETKSADSVEKLRRVSKCFVFFEIISLMSLAFVV